MELFSSTNHFYASTRARVRLRGVDPGTHEHLCSSADTSNLNFIGISIPSDAI